MDKLILDNIEPIRIVCKNHFVKSLYVFGSAVNNAMNEDSDIDFLYEIDLDHFTDWDKGEYDYVKNLDDIQMKLQSILGRKIDLVKNKYFQNKYLRTSIEQSKTKIYGS